MKKQWSVYKAWSSRTAALVGTFVGSLDFAIEVEQRANRLWKVKSKKHREDRYKVFLCDGVKNPRFTKGW